MFVKKLKPIEELYIFKSHRVQPLDLAPELLIEDPDFMMDFSSGVHVNQPERDGSFGGMYYDYADYDAGQFDLLDTNQPAKRSSNSSAPKRMCNFASHDFTTELFTVVSEGVWAKLDSSGDVNPPQIGPLLVDMQHQRRIILGNEATFRTQHSSKSITNLDFNFSKKCLSFLVFFGSVELQFPGKNQC